ncbi:hypothetical protein [Sphingomonas sp.]|jgi:hypothetical protein|uniref:hypothetical protein n=1 Tax=Sphingomonas sp. TaxID=28214 RepID=UPI002629B67C|nr:hypothetical protein [Sphingomonas sp.]MDF2494576.1 hypothetical protein [Sphingomonas sp.]
MTLSFEPLAGHNAIESCALVIRFVTPIDAPTFEALTVQAAALATENGLPGRQQQVMPQFVFGSGIPTNLPVGVSFQRFATDGQIEAELKCEMQALTLTVRKYDSWSGFFDFASKVALALVPVYLGTVPAIASVLLQYEDVFLAVEGNPPAGEVFREGTRWVTMYDRASDQPWHSHFGVFIPQSPMRRRLVNVNVTVADQARAPHNIVRRVADLTVLTGDMFDVEGQPPLLVERGREAEIVGDLIKNLHEFQKTILAQVLSDDYLAAIGC